MTFCEGQRREAKNQVFSSAVTGPEFGIKPPPCLVALGETPSHPDTKLPQMCDSDTAKTVLRIKQSMWEDFINMKAPYKYFSMKI